MKSISEIREISQPSSSIDKENPWKKYFLRRMSIYLTMLCIYLPVTSNQISLLMIFIGIIGGFFFGIGGYINNLIGIIFIQLFMLFDCVDGEVARYKRQSSIKGEYLDLLANDIIHVSIFLGLTVGIFNNYKLYNILLSHSIIIFGLSATIFPLLYKISIFYVKEIHGEFIILSNIVLQNKKDKKLKSFLISLIYPDNVINTVCVFAIINLLPFVLIGYGIIFLLLFVLSTIIRFKNL